MIKLIHGECLQEMDKLIEQDIKVDAIITDPPYGTTKCKWDSIIPLDQMWQRLNSLIKPNGAIVLFGSQPFTSSLIMSNPKMFKYEWIWTKSKPSGMASAKYKPMQNHENIIVFSKNKTKFNPIKEERDMSSSSYEIYKKYKIRNSMGSNTSANIVSKDIEYIKRDENFRNPTTSRYFKSTPQRGRFHPTQKPVDLMEYLIKTYTNENELVLDFTMGSGTTGVACKTLNRNFIGIEKDKKYFEIAKNRIENN